VTEKEKREDEALKNCIQEAYGLSDEQLLAELEEIEASISDDEFVGAEERIYSKIKERELERSLACSEEIAVSAEIPASNPTSIRKISKKKKWLVVGIAAALVVGAGANAIGGNNYFLRQRVKEEGIVLNSGQNIVKASDLEEAYDIIEKETKESMLRLSYIPSKLKFKDITIEKEYVAIRFMYDKEIVYFIREQKVNGISVGINSDREENGKQYFNDWIKKEITLEEYNLENGAIEFSANLIIENTNYRFIGKLPETEIIKIIKGYYFR